jgi:3-methyladenine DNA glycosylase AlkD
MKVDQTSIMTRAQVLLTQAADPVKAAPMAAYMKTDMPFYGVTSRDRKAISRHLTSQFPAASRAEYEAAVRALWRGSHREEKYLAVSYARAFPRYVTLSSIPMYQMMITQGAWWDFVDEIAAHLVGGVLLNQREGLTPRLDAWTTNHDMWLRRTSILSQLRHKSNTDTEFLEAACSRNLADNEFFIRKAIGWALREYAKTDPAWVLEFVLRHEAGMSGLTYREAMKHLR